MSHRHALALLGLMLVAIGLFERSWLLLAVWLGGDFLALGVAHARGFHRLKCQSTCLQHMNDKPGDIYLIPLMIRRILPLTILCFSPGLVRADLGVLRTHPTLTRIFAGTALWTAL